MRQDVEPFLHKCVGGEVCSELLVPRYEALGLQLKEALVAGMRKRVIWGWQLGTRWTPGGGN